MTITDQGRDESRDRDATRKRLRVRRLISASDEHNMGGDRSGKYSFYHKEYTPLLTLTTIYTSLVQERHEDGG